MFAYALIHSSPPEVVFAENEDVLSEILAREFIAQVPAAEFGRSELDGIRRALLERRWADAVLAWINHTGVAVDVYGSADVRTAASLDPGSYRVAVQMTPLFEDLDG